MEGSIAIMAWTTVMGAVVLLICTAVMFQWPFWLDMFRYRNKLPRGSYGWPLIGETLSLQATTPTQFATSRVAKYGKLFKTHLFGDPTIVITSPDLARALYSKPYDHVHITGPLGSQTLLGETVMHFLADKDHEGLHKLVQTFFFLPSIGPRIPETERVIVNQLNAWDGKIVNCFQDTRKASGNVLMRMLLGFEHGEDDHFLSELVEIFRGPYYTGFLSLPIKLPGTGFYKGLKAREKLTEIINYLIDKYEKSSGGRKSGNCLLQRLLEHKHPSTGEHMARRTIVDNLLVVMFAGFDTTASTFSMSLRHLWENPKVLELVKAEQEAIARRKSPGEPLTATDLNDMRYTNQVLHETLRLPGPVPFSVRETSHEIEIDGYTIPKGWKIVNLFTLYQQDPSFFANPTVFDPSRFSDHCPKEGSKGFTPFGGGRHMCPGREQAKVTFKILMHHFLTKFRWEPVKFQGGYEHFPILMCSPKGGFPIEAKLIIHNPELRGDRNVRRRLLP